MVDTRDKFNEVATAIALYKMSLICAISSFPQEGQYCYYCTHQSVEQTSISQQLQLLTSNYNY